jgi:two-component system, LytTR family, response regulator
MKQEGRIEAQSRLPQAAASLHLLVVSSAIVFTAYTLTVYVANDVAIGTALAVAAANTLPVILLGAPVFILARDGLAGQGLQRSVVAHLVLCAAFSLLGYWLLVVMLGLAHGASPTEFWVRPFTSRNMAWQLLENATIYAVIVALAALQGRPRPVTLILGKGSAGDDPKARASRRYFIRRGDQIHAIDVSSIVSISGADDYSEIATAEGKHLVRMTLSEFERSLNPTTFIRVHRSRIVNVECIARAEPAGGGRLLLHMADGEMISASRAGSRMFKDRAI